MKTKSKNIFENEFCKIFTQDKKIQSEVLKQLKNVSKIKGIFKKPICMPDYHLGYGFPIGSVCSFEKEKAKIIPGGVGFDINCGVRLLKTNLTKKDLKGKTSFLLEKILEKIKINNLEKKDILNLKSLKEILEKGVMWCLENNFAKKNDLEKCEMKGTLKPVNSKLISQKAIGKGRIQLGTLGNGNHFLEIGAIDKIFDKKIMKQFHLEKNQIVILIHCGSRGLGHQVAKEFIEKIKKNSKENFLENLEQIDLNSKIGKEYLCAMNCASNFAYVNRQMITHKLREVFEKFFSKKSKIDLVYDISHNILREETHKIKGRNKNFLVIRKGATSAFKKNSINLKDEYKKIGQPIILPASCGTNSYLLLGLGNEKSFSSCPHGAGRVMSRKEAVKKIKGEEVEKNLLKNGTIIKGFSDYKNIAQESPKVYKKIDKVIKIIEEEKLAKIICNFKPLGVIKG